jgi:hypothetical protein
MSVQIFPFLQLVTNLAVFYTFSHTRPRTVPSLGWIGSCYCKRILPEKGTYPNPYHSVTHMPSTCLQESDSLFPFGRQFEDGTLSFLSQWFQVTFAAAPRNVPQKCSSIRHNSPRGSMQTHYLVNIDFCIFFCLVGGMHWQEMSCFG